MASKEEKAKKKAGRDDRKSGKDNVGCDEFRKPKRLKCKPICFTVTVYGHPQVVQMILQHFPQSETLELKTMQYKVYITVVNGNDWVGRPTSDGADLILCVYDVCNAQTAGYLKDYVLPYMKENRKIMAIAGIGLENRKLGGANLTDVGACLQLCRLYGCHGSEVVGSRGPALAAGILALYGSAFPEKFVEICGEKDEGMKDSKVEKKGKKLK